MKGKKIIVTLMICAVFSVSAFCQTTGKVVDTNRKPIEGATIVMQLPDSTYLGAVISAADGTFILEPEPESYQLIVQHLLYQTRLVKGQARDAGIIALEPKDYNLEEVVIKGERPFVTVEHGTHRLEHETIQPYRFSEIRLPFWRQYQQGKERDRHLTIWQKIKYRYHTDQSMGAMPCACK